MNHFAAWLIGHPFIRFGFVGALGYVVGASVLALASGPLHLPFAAANGLAIILAMLFTWQGNRHITFRAQRARGFAGATREWFRFAAANALGAALNYVTALAVVHYAPLPFSNKFVAQALGVLVGMVSNFTLSRKMVFKDSA